MRAFTFVGLLLAIGIVLALAASGAQANAFEEEVSENPEVQAVCPEASPGYAECMSYEIEPEGEPAFQGSGEFGGFSPADLQSAYKLNTEAGKGLTIAIVDAFDDPNAEADLAEYRSRYGLPPCTTANGCFKKINQLGEEKNYPAPNANWSGEIALDLDMASAVCPQCKIVLVESTTNSSENLYIAEEKAASLSPAAISNSWGNFEYSVETSSDKYFNHPGIPITFSAGDEGYVAEYPAASPYVISVGGTALTKDPGGTRGWSEQVWKKSGSGCSAYEAKPTWQKDTPCGKRMISDVSAVADPATPVSVYDTYKAGGWLLFGGTSASSPIIAGIEALSTPTMRSQGAQAFYNGTALLFDISAGTNGLCTPPTEKEYYCNGELGYDGPTGNGTPGRTVTGAPVAVSHAGSITPYTVQLTGLVNPEGSSTTYRFEYGQTTSYGETIPPKEGSAGSGTSNVSVSKGVYNLNPESLYHYRLVATNSKGTTKGEDHTFVTPSVSVPAPPTFAAKYGSAGEGSGQYRFATGVAVIPTSGNVAVADAENDRIQILNSAGEYVRTIGESGSENGQLNSPGGIATDPEGNIYVADNQNNRIVKFSETGTFINNFGVGKISAPWDVALDASGDIWVASVSKGLVTEFNSAGTYIRSFASGSEGYGPTAVTVDSAGNVWTTTGEHRVEEHSSTGEFLREFGATGDNRGQLYSLRDIQVDANGNIWLTDWDQELFAAQRFARVDIYSNNGKYLDSFGEFDEEAEEAEEEAGPDKFFRPWGIAFDPRGGVWVSDASLFKVTKWQLPTPWPPTYSSSIGSEGTGPGQFKSAAGVAVIPTTGNLAVVDSGNNRVEVLTPAGGVVKVFGELGSGNGQLSSPMGVAADSAGNLYVADYGNNRVEKFSETGTFMQVIGTGKLSNPWELAVDTSGNVWVTDYPHNEAKEFNSSGTYVRAFSTGAGPSGLAIDSKGNVWTSAANSSTPIEEHSATGALIRKFGATGSGDGKLSNPRGIAVDREGHVWVADRLNHRVEVFGETGEYITKFGSVGSGSEQFNNPYFLDLDPRGNIWITDTTNNRVSRWHVASPWPPAYSSTFGTEGTGQGQFKEAGGVAVDPRNGNVVVADEGNNRIQVFNASGELIRFFGETGSGNGQFNHPTSVTVDAAGFIYVADSSNARVQKFSDTGAFKQVIGSGKLSKPLDVAVDSSGNVWVTDSLASEAKEFNSAGTYLRSFATGGSSGGITVDSEDNVWTATSGGTNHVEEHSPTGTLLQAFGKSGSGDGLLNYSMGIEVDSSGYVWIADRNNHRVQVFSKTGEYVTQFGTLGSGEGQFLNSYWLALDSRGNIWVSDRSANRITKWVKK